MVKPIKQLSLRKNSHIKNKYFTNFHKHTELSGVFLGKQIIPTHSIKHTSSSYTPCHKGYVNKKGGNCHQERKTERLRQFKGTNGVHAHGENHSPVLRVILKGELFKYMPPNAKYYNKRYPPSAYCPIKECKPFQERKD